MRFSAAALLFLLLLSTHTALAALAPHKLALQHAKEGRFAEAISLFEVSLEARPKRPKVWVNLGVTLLRKGIDDVQASRVDDARAAFERAGRSFDTALELDPSSAGAAASLRDLNGARLKYFPAAPAGSAAPGSSTDDQDGGRLEPLPGKSLTETGMKYGNDGDIDMARAYFQAATEATPDEVTVWNNLAVALLRQGMNGKVSPTTAPAGPFPLQSRTRLERPDKSHLRCLSASQNHACLARPL